VTVDLKNAPVGRKAVYVYKKGDCSDIEGASMGARMTPAEGQHATKKHTGDLGTFEVGKDGMGKLKAKSHGATLKADDPHSLLSKSIVIELADGTSREPGKAKPIACAVIEAE